MTLTTWMRTFALALICTALAQAETPIPKELEGWQPWVQYGQEFRRCPFLAGTDGSDEGNRICAWPGRLNLELNQGGGRFMQTWISYTDGWVSLPGNLEYWPGAVTVNGAAAAVVAVDGVPQIRVQAGTFALSGSFTWSKQPESLPVPAHTGLIELNLDGHRLDQVNRPNDSVWLGKRHEAEVAQQLDVQIYRLLSDGTPTTLETRLNLQVAGDVREQTLPHVLPQGFQAMSLQSELPARIDSEGQLRVQVRAGSWTITVAARAADDLGSIKIPSLSGNAPQQEVWSYASNDRLRVAALEGAESIDPGQANVPQEWRRYPSYRVQANEVVRLVERSRGVSPQEGNHLDLQRQLYLDFAHQGYTAVDQISGQMRSTWRLDMRAPYRLMRVASGPDDLLVTETDGLTGVELRRPGVSLGTVARIANSGGPIPASGWTERMDHVSGVLNLPPGHRLLAAFGADSAPGAWVERWGLLDLFLLLICSVLALRLFGWQYAIVTFFAVALLHQENPWLVWLILSVNSASALGRALPSGWPQTATIWSRNLLLGLLLLVSVPFAIEQVRFALYPQLADRSELVAPVEIAQIATASSIAGSHLSGLNRAPAPNFVPPPAAAELQEITTTSMKRSTNVRDPDALSTSAQPRQRYAPGTSIQAGPGLPQWRYATYDFGWSGPVDATQTVRFVVLTPVVVGIWRVLGIALLAALFVRMMRGGPGIRAEWRRVLATRGILATLVVSFGCMTLGSPSRANSTPDNALLNDLRSRLSQPAQCVPHCAEIMAARLVLTPDTLETSLDVAALSSVAVALPTAGDRFDPEAISLDGVPVSGVFRDDDQKIWIALKPGTHSVKMSTRLPTSDSIQLLFPQVPRGIVVSGDGWDVSGVNAGRLLGNTLELLRRRAAGHDAETPHAAAQFPAYVRIRRAFSLDLDWSLQTTIERLAPDKGGFTLAIPLLAGESILTSGIETNPAMQVLAAFDSDAMQFDWHSSLPQSETLTLTAAKDKPWSELWSFKVGPMWRVLFSGVPAILPENLRTDWTFEYIPRAGETLTLKISRPAAAPGDSLAIDKVDFEVEQGKRSASATLRFNYRSTQGGRHTLRLPDTARVTAVMADRRSVPVRPENGVLALALSPGQHEVEIQWQSSASAELIARTPAVDLQLPSSNVNVQLHMPTDRWVLYATGSGVGPAVLYWGELIVFIVVAIAVGRSRRSPLRTHEWLLLGLGLSTFSWSALLLFAAWMFAVHWRQGFDGAQLSRQQYNLLQSTLILLSLAAVIALVAAIPSGLLGNPDMRIAGVGQSPHELSWFSDQASGVLPSPWVLSLSIWWYKAAMLLWALWLAFALVRWLPIAWRALAVGGFWRGAAPAKLSTPNTAPEVDA